MFKLRYVLLIISVLVLQSNLWGQEIKIGVVNSELVIKDYKRFEEANEQLAREAEGWELERKGWVADMERLQKVIVEKESSWQAGQYAMSEKRKLELRSEIDSLSRDLNLRYNTQTQKEQELLNLRRTQLLSKVFEEVNEVIEEIGVENDFQLIIDASNGSIVYAKDPEDLNDQLIQRLKDK